MKFARFEIFILLLLAIGAGNVSIVYNLDQFFLRPFFTSIMALLVPGILINLILRVKNISKWEYFLYAIGGSVSFLMLNGLFINTVLPLLQIPDPLSFSNIFKSFNITTAILFLIAFLRNKQTQFTLTFLKLSVRKALFYSLPISFPLLSVFGAISQNNGGSNYLTMTMLLASALYIGFITFFKKYLSSAIYPFTLFMVSLSVLLMLSFRSWHISGFDISIEYEVFQITKQHMHWALEYFKNEYNTCLSITILPTYLSQLLNIKDVYIYKFFFQIIFALAPVSIYFFAKKLHSTTLVAFLAGLFYICNPWFIDPMTTLNRQEIAFFFFILVLTLFFEKKLSTVTKYSLLCLMSVGLVVSHYSSTYITVLLFSLVFLFGMLVKLMKKLHFPFIRDDIHLNIKPLYLLFLLITAFTWYSVINNSTKNLSDVARNTYTNLPNIFNNELKTSIIDQLINPKKEPISEETYQEYYKIKSGEYSDKSVFDRYSEKLYSDYRIESKKSPQVPVINKPVATMVNYVYLFSILMIELFLIVGTLSTLFSKKGKLLDPNLILFMFVSEFILVLMTVLPYISVGYNFDRLYMQVMFILSLIQIIGALTFVTLLTRNKRLALKILSIFYITVFLFTYGAIWQIVGGKTVMWLNNFGYYYNQTYTHTSDYLSALWMKRLPDNPRIYSTATGRNILAAYAHKNHVKTDVFPSTIETYAYVYVTNSNLTEKISSFYYRGEHLEYEYPFDFIRKNKNLIYSNGGSEVYK